MNKSWFAVVLLALGAVFSIVPAAAQQSDGAKIALLIGNSNYPDAEAPLRQPIPDARALADELRRNGFDVDVAENLTKEGMQRALQRLYGKIKPGASALIFFSGYGIQTGRQTYFIPVNAQIWTEAEVRRDGIGIDTVLAEMNARGAGVKIAIMDASRRNPFERRFRGMSSGLAPVTAPRGTLVISAAAPGMVLNDGDSDNSLFVRELIKEMRSPGLAGEEAFNRTRIGVSRASRGEQVPWISSSLIEDFYFGKPAAIARTDHPPAPPQLAPPPPAPPQITLAPSASPQLTPPPAAPPQVTPPPAALAPAPPSPPPRDPDADVRRDYEFAERLGTRQGWEDFLGKHKSGPYADLAGRKLADLGPPSRPPPPEPKPDPLPKVEPRPEPMEQVKEPLVRELDEVIARNPNDGDAYYKRGIAHAQKSRFAEAIKDFDEAIRVNPKDSEAFNNRCWSRAMVGDLQAALKDCNESLRLKPNFVDALDSRGLVNLKIGQSTSAIADYNAALRVNPKHASALFGRGKAKLRSGDTAGGNADIAAAKAINRDIAQEFESYGIK